MPGFRVKFEADPAHTVGGWDPIEQDFGNVGVDYTPVPVVNLNFENELTEIATCVDDIWINAEPYVELERFKFKESDGN